jgi:quinol monooxygenase YgiN
MIIYEVNLTVDPDIADEYAAWLRPHIAHILEIDGFLGAEWLDRDTADENGDSEKVRWSIQYRLRDRAALEAYQRDHAPPLIREGQVRFGGHFTTTRRVLALREALQPQPKYG